MKKTSLFLSITSAVLALGIVLIIIGVVAGGSIRSLSIEPVKETHEFKNVSHELTDEDTIENLDFSLGANNITFQTGDQFRITGGHLSKNEVENGTWTVRSTFFDHFTKISVFGFKIPVPKAFYKNNQKEENITIELPRDMDLNKITLDLSAADVVIDSIHCQNFKLELSAGDVHIRNLETSTAAFDASAGSTDIDSYQISKSATLDCSAGDITLGTKSSLSSNLCNNLKAGCSMGDIDVYGKLSGTTDLDCSMGDIDLNLYGGKDNYAIAHTSQSMGDINYTSKGSSSDTTQFGTLKLDCSMGDIDVVYCGE